MPLRRNPDIKWSAEKRNLERYHRIQSALLAQAGRLTAVGGTLVYAVCSPEPEETTDVVRAFLAGHDGFAVDRDLSALPEPARAGGQTPCSILIAGIGGTGVLIDRGRELGEVEVGLLRSFGRAITPRPVGHMMHFRLQWFVDSM